MTQRFLRMVRLLPALSLFHRFTWISTRCPMRSTASSQSPRATSQTARSLAGPLFSTWPLPRTSRSLLLRRCWVRSGGCRWRARTGGTPRGPGQTFSKTGERTTLSCRSPGRTRPSSASGAVVASPRRRSGSTRRGAIGWSLRKEEGPLRRPSCSPGAMTWWGAHRAQTSTGPTYGRGNSPIKIRQRTGTYLQALWTLLARRTTLACTT
mmetsp:Transcript_19700/g.28461  ORF Transcript_19700/g.28461 Transcript_19700/m.28461 type:complete len:209 (+) Transcript_19700:388-1014(+)